MFGAVVIALFGYVYWSTASYVLQPLGPRHRGGARQSCTGRTTGAGRGGLVAAIEQRLADRRFDGGFYLLADPSYAPLAGNLANGRRR